MKQQIAGTAYGRAVLVIAVLAFIWGVLLLTRT